MNSVITRIVLVFWFISGQAFADESVNTAKIPDTGKNKIPGAEAVDELITNNNLRALSGSTSKWSFASQWNYLGGTVENPLTQERPNISSASATTPKTDLDGSVNIKYNLDVKNSILVGFGVRWIAPLTPGGPTNYKGTTYDAMNPSVTFQHIYKFSGIQSVLQIGVMQYTQADVVADGYAQQLQLDQENIYDVGTTGLSIGGSIGASTNFFSKSSAELDQAQSVYQIWFSPYVEYKLSDKVNLRTVSNLATFEYYKTGNIVRDVTTQSVGVGFSITRNFFLYPNVQFLPDHIVASLTNVGLGATINLF